MLAKVDGRTRKVRLIEKIKKIAEVAMEELSIKIVQGGKYLSPVFRGTCAHHTRITAIICELGISRSNISCSCIPNVYFPLDTLEDHIL